MYDDVRELPNARGAILDFLESAYQAGGKKADWPVGDLIWQPA